MMPTETVQNSPVLFREEQRFRQLWIWLLILFIAAIQWWGFIQQIIFGQPWGDNPGPDWMIVTFWLLFGIGLPLFFLYLRLIVTVSDAAVEIHFRPLARRTIAIADIRHVKPGTYSPLRSYGGWGVRGLGDNVAYNVSGNQGVKLTLADGKTVLIGSQRTAELALAIETAQRR